MPSPSDFEGPLLSFCSISNFPGNSRDARFDLRRAKARGPKFLSRNGRLAGGQKITKANFWSKTIAFCLGFGANHLENHQNATLGGGMRKIEVHGRQASISKTFRRAISKDPSCRFAKFQIVRAKIGGADLTSGGPRRGAQKFLSRNWPRVEGHRPRVKDHILVHIP